MSRVDQLNSLLLREIALFVRRDVYLPDGLITITYVDCSADLNQAKIGFSVLPETLTGTALALLRKNSNNFHGQLKRKLTLKFIPRLIWVVDDRPQRAGEIDTTLKELGF